jgi:uncharacterized protein with ATP-grasp and redox domains
MKIFVIIDLIFYECSKIIAMNHKCIFCFTKLFNNLLEKHIQGEEEKNKLAKSFFSYLSGIDTSLPTPYIARDIHAMIRNYLNNSDPYKEEKKENNTLILDVYDYLKERIHNAADPFKEALKLSIAGNIMDYGPTNKFNIMDTVFQLEKYPIAIDYTENLRDQIKSSERILYLGDNAGEIVFDKLFLETINHPQVIYTVRGAPVINDITREDAKMVGMDEVAKVIDNGYDAPSTIVEQSSKKFQDYYQSADLIISKGQGNFEGLMNKKDKRIFHLLMVKCQVIGDYVGVDKGSILIYN